MRDYNEEAAMLEALSEALAGFEHVVTYNGKMFDLPLLEARFRLNRVRFPLADVLHLDLLHPARRLWKLRLESCRLQSLEGALLGVARRGDIPGEEIPRAYFRYLRSRDPGAVGRIFEHNRVDIVSLAALLTLACQWIEEARAEDARDVYSLARVLERAQRYERSQAEYRRALALDPGPLRAPALMRLAAHARRAGDASQAARLWEEAAREGECTAFRELAVHHERRRRDAAAALRVVDAALAALAGRELPCCRRARREFERRRLRLAARLRRAAEAQASLR
jgi:tetratricopeptide (TPR) repeat protein